MIRFNKIFLPMINFAENLRFLNVTKKPSLIQRRLFCYNVQERRVTYLTLSLTFFSLDLIGGSSSAVAASISFFSLG